MFVPLKDDNPLRVIRFQYVALALIVVNVCVFLVTSQLLSDDRASIVLNGFGVVPSELFDVQRLPSPMFDLVSEPLTLLTSSFFHVGWLHLLGNVAFLWVFGDNIEDAFGHLGFLLFYILCAVVSALVHAWMQPNSHEPLIGASGAVSGVMAAYMLLYPRARVWVLLFMRIPLKVPAWTALGGWIGFQIFSLLLEQPDIDYSVAWWAHIGGFAVGVVFTLLVRSPLWSKRHH